MNQIAILPMQDTHADSVLAIYREGIETGHATFEARVPDWDAFTAGHLDSPRLVALDGAAVVGWAALSPVSRRQVYCGVSEVSVYVSGAAQGRGTGRVLLAALVQASEEQGIWTLQASIFHENAASLRLHAAQGFRQVGVRRRIAKMTYGPLAGAWRDTILLERRSARAGND